ncbi:MAG TPA: B12-binding domain-containing radical SAM protein, partial [Nitrospirae bacterium]|nr:B12-binding domain-containing radical SAM protein [Nitrospirota bacterium]
MKLLLISLQSNAYVTGLKYIAENVRANGHDAKILLLPGYLEKTLDPVIEKFIRDYKPDLIGIGLMSIEFYPAKNATRILREKFDTPIIWGGVHVIITPDECLQYADYICCGEGERSVVSLLDHLRDKGRDVIPEIPNIWVNDRGNIVRQPKAPPEADLDSLPFQPYLPDYYYVFHKNTIVNFSQDPDLFHRYALYGGTCHMLITSRGCPFYCGYCANSFLMTVYGKKVRARSPENVIEELKDVKKDPYVIYINIEDDCFFVHSREWMRKFCDEYKKYINLPFIVRAIPTMLDKEKLMMLKDAGLSWVIMGVQSGSDRVNFDIYERKIHFSSVMKAAELLSEAKAAPFYEMIVDNPYETEETEMETIDSMAKLKRPYAISLAHLTFFPGTPLAARAVRDNIADPEAYLYRYPVKIDMTYRNKLLYLAPYIPRSVVRFLNK